MRTRELSRATTGYLIGDGAASPPILSGAHIYCFRLKAGAVTARAIFRDGGPAGPILRSLVAVANTFVESKDEASARDAVFVLIDNNAGGAIAGDPNGAVASIQVDAMHGKTRPLHGTT